jgi:hypothetical protein
MNYKFLIKIFAMLSLVNFNTINTENDSAAPELHTANYLVHKKIDLDVKNRVQLTHNLLAKLDGFFIGATQVKNMLELIALIRTLQIGVYHKETKTHAGLFVWKEQKVGIHELGKIENDPALTTEDRKLLKKMLHKAREQFLLKTQKNSERTAPIKTLILRLITECCEKRSLGNSFLLTWGETSLENEAINFHQGILSFTDLDKFLTHLTIFMKDLIYSCPKAFEQFNQVYSTNNNRNLGENHHD